MDSIDLSSALDHLAEHHYVILEREIVAATGRSKRTVRDWLNRGAPQWVWHCALAFRGIFEVNGEYWRIDRDKQEIITPDRDIRRLGEIRGIRYMIGAKNTYKRLSERQRARIEELEAENARLRAQRPQRPVWAANDEY